jgi:hypothetical protein
MERRGARRIEYSCEVECEGASPDPIRPRMRDLSATGAFIESSTPVRPGVHLMFSFVLPSGRIFLTAEVVRLADGGMGVRFLDLTESQQHLIDAAVAEDADGP